MFVTVRFGNDQHQIFNPDCSVVNLLTDIKRRCTVGMSRDVDLTDETGLLVGISKANPSERALKYLSLHDTYVLVEKRQTTEHSIDERVGTPRAHLAKGNKTGRVNIEQPRDHYFPLLLCVNKIYPEYFFHRSRDELKPTRRGIREIRRSQLNNITAVSNSHQRTSIATPQRLNRVSITQGMTHNFSARRNYSARRLTLIT